MLKNLAGLRNDPDPDAVYLVDRISGLSPLARESKL
jgi:hypothetical protein